jgi:hypothetical protein
MWLAEARDRSLARLERGRDRDRLVDHLLDLAARESALVVGLDFAFSFPAWFLRTIGVASAPEAWDLAAREGESWLERCDPPLWGRPGKPRPPLARGRSPFRRTEGERLPIRGVAPKSVFQIGGDGSVGTGSIRGMPALLRLRAAGFAIWPFDPPRFPMALEIYPRWLTGRVQKRSAVSRRLHLAVHAGREDRALVEIAASNEDAFDAAASAIEMARHAASFARLEPATEREHRLEGRIWNPGPLGKDPARLRL